MIVSWYSKAIRVVGAQTSQKMVPNQGAQWTPLEAIAEKQYAKLFVDFTKKLLDQIKSVSMGKDLIQEIDQSGHRLTIGLERNGGNSTAPEKSDATVQDRYFKPFRKPKANAVSHMKSNLGTMPLWRLTQPDDYYLSRLKKAINKSPFTFDQFARMIIEERQVTNDEKKAHPNQYKEYKFKDMIEGTTPIDDETCYKICLYLHDYLEPGKGVDIIIGFSATNRAACLEDQKRDWESGEVPHVILCHEMIHAWRQMVGKRIFLGGVGEEHMTTGLPPYSNMKFTENKYRLQCKLALRDHYSAGVYDAFSGTLGMPWMSRSGRPKTAKFWAFVTKKN